VTFIGGALDITTSRPLASLPRIDCLVRERADSPRYYQNPALRPHRQVAIQITLSGHGMAWPSSGGAVLLPPGSALCFVTGRKQLHYGFPPQGGEVWDFVYANLAGSTARAIVDDLTARHGHRIDLGRKHPLIKALLTRLPAQARRHQRWTASESAGLAWDMLEALIQAAEHTDDDPELLDHAMRLLIRDLSTPPDIATVAAAIGCSREHLTRRFRSEIGRTPAAWQREQRLRHAGTLLRSGTSVTDTARRTGFATTSHFIQAFKKSHGTTPATYARQA
jgi:AraC-like DNA-binding protein